MRLDGYDFFRSEHPHKKYDVYKNGRFITSFGDSRYEQYYDKIGLWSHLDHHDSQRRRLYRLRHANDRLDDKESAGYFSYHYLW